MTESATYPRSKTMQSGSQEEVSGAADGAKGTRRKLNDAQEREVTRLYCSTETPVSEISKRFGIGESSVYRVAQRHGAALRMRTETAAKSAAARPAAGVGRATRGGRRRAAAGTDATPSANGRRTGARAARPAGAPTARRTVGRAAAGTATQATRAGRAPIVARREFRVSYVAVRTFVAATMADAIRQAEAAGATDITGIERGAGDVIDLRPASEGKAFDAMTRRQRLALADQELTEVTERLASELRARSPELFDARGRLRKGAVAERIATRKGDRTWLSARELISI